MSTSIPVVLNASAGAGPDGAAVEAAFARVRLAVELRTLDAYCKEPDGDDAARPPVVVAGGGDGTMGTVAGRLLDSPTALGVLALGTLNHFAKDLGIPLELEQAVQVIADGATHCVDVGEVNGACFLNNASLGLYPRMVLARDNAQRRLHLGKWPALVRASWQALRHPRALDVTLVVDGQRLRRRTPFLFVGNNRYVLSGTQAGQRRALDGGVLSLHVLRPQSPAGLIWMALRTLCGLHTRERDFEQFLVPGFRVEAGGRTLEVARDGEVDCVASPLEFRIRPQALRVIVPKEAA